MNEHDRTGLYRAGSEAVFAFWFQNVLSPRRYFATITVAHRGTGLDLIDRYAREYSFVVTGSHATGGIVDVPFHTSFELVREGPRPAAEEPLSA
jgi:hypothetical protein